MERTKSKVLVVGGTGYLGRRLVRASLAEGHPTYVLQQPTAATDIDKIQVLLSHKKAGVGLIEGSLDDHRSLVDAVRHVDVVICAVSGVPIRSHHISLQLKLIEAIKEAGNIKVIGSGGVHDGSRSHDLKVSPERFLPSEFGSYVPRMLNSILPGRTFFGDKMIVRKAIEDAKIPFTYICSNCSMGYFIAGLCEAGKLLPSRESVSLHGDGNVKAIFVEEDDIAKYTIKTIDDPRTLNKTLFINPPENIMTQCEVVEIWEALIGRELQKASVSREDFLNGMKDFNPAVQVGFCHYYNVFHEGCLTNFEIDDYGEEASKLYPEVNYTRVKEFLEHYV